MSTKYGFEGVRSGLTYRGGLLDADRRLEYSEWRFDAENRVERVAWKDVQCRGLCDEVWVLTCEQSHGFTGLLSRNPV